MFAIPYIVSNLILFSPNLIVCGHHISKEICDMRSRHLVCITLDRQRGISNHMYAHICTYADSRLKHQHISSVMRYFTNARMIIFSSLFSPYQNTPNFPFRRNQDSSEKSVEFHSDNIAFKLHLQLLIFSQLLHSCIILRSTECTSLDYMKNN